MATARADARGTAGSATPTVEASDLGLVAQGYAARGWRVFPCHSIRNGACTCGDWECRREGKHPRLAHGVKEATKDPETIEGWWTLWPRANIAIACGEASGLVVIDIDPEHGGELSLQALEAAHGALPETGIVRTGGGGRHFYFVHPGAPIGNKVGLAQGIDMELPRFSGQCST
jgi:hypothetical protein